LKIHYSTNISSRDSERKIFVNHISSFFLEETDFSNGHKQDRRNRSAELNLNSGRLQATQKFRETNKVKAENISYEYTREMLKNMFAGNKNLCIDK
jgi:hypothetical protein